jgi:hypothetical protein
MKKTAKKYYCRHCGKKFNSFYMSEICFMLDIKKLEYENKIDLSVNKLQKQSGNKQPGK